MKTPEECFVEITKLIKNIKKVEDDNESKLKSFISWSKCRNYNGIAYTFEGSIDIDTNVTLHYFFSNKRSCIYLIQNTVDIDINKLQYNLLLFTEYMFGKYSIDLFINRLVNIN
jgi:hypothetical protein